MLNINLIPPTIKLKIKQIKQTVHALRVSALLVFLFILASIASTIISSNYYTQKLQNNTSEVAQEKASLTEFDLYKNQALEINERVKIASQIDAKRVKWSEVLQNLNNLTPQSVIFNEIKTMTDKSPNITLFAQSDAEINIVLLQDKLKKSPFFKNVGLKNSAGQAESIPFSLEFDLQNQSIVKTKTSLK